MALRQNFGISGIVLSQGMHIWNMQALLPLVQKLLQKLKSKVTVKVTRPLTLLSLVEYSCQIWSLSLLVQTLWQRLKFFATDRQVYRKTHRRTLRKDKTRCLWTALSPNARHHTCWQTFSLCLHNQMARQIVELLWRHNRMTSKSHMESHMYWVWWKVNSILSSGSFEAQFWYQ